MTHIVTFRFHQGENCMIHTEVYRDCGTPSMIVTVMNNTRMVTLA